MTIAMKYPFTEAEFKAASDAWGCNCGPSALAFATQKSLEAARHAIPGFEAKRYTSPTMMRDALAFLGLLKRRTPRGAWGSARNVRRPRGGG